MVINEGTAYDTGGVYREIDADRKLVFAWGATAGWPERVTFVASLADVRRRIEGGA